MSEYLNQLSPVQQEAAVNFQGPSIIIAGAGSGKTRVLTYRIAYMLEQGVAPYNILALTFTNKAAREMKERIEGIVSARARSLWMGTFHSIFARILRNEADKLGYPSSFTIYDTTDSKNVVKQIIKEMNLSDETYKVNEIYSRISLAKNNLVTAATYESNSMLMAEDRERRRPLFHEVYKRYVFKCKEYGAMDFDDLLLNMNILFRDFPDVLAKYQHQFRYVMVDEYQDTNMAQYLIIKKLVEGHKNICVVGDDAQSIYSFRGAKIENILRFQQDYPEAKLFKLEQNYRSTQTIVNAANCVIEKNQKQLRKTSFSANSEGEKIKVYKAYTDQEEALIVVNDINSLVRAQEEIQYNEIAILYRTNAQSRVLEEALRSRNIPYKIFGGQSFYQRKEIKDVLAYIRLAVNHKDDEALRRIINYPTRGIGDVTIAKIANTAQKHNISMWEVISTLTPEQMDLRGAAGKKITDFKQMIQELSSQIYTTPAYEMGLKIATRSGIIGSFKMQQAPEAMSVLENIEELLNSIASYTEIQAPEQPENTLVTIDAWLQNVSLLTDMDNEKDEDRNRVTLMTVHSAKGLEFGYVYIVGLEETLFPSQMCMDSMESLEEERRLFYVALTRAKKEAVLTFSNTRFRWGNVTSNRPSRFIKEIDPEYLDLKFQESDDNYGESNEWEAARERFNAGGSSSAPKYGSGNRPAYGQKYARKESNSAGGRTTPPPPAASVTSRSRMGMNMKSIGKYATAENEATERPATTAPAGTPNLNGPLAAGSLVEHDKFGQGQVMLLEKTPHGAKATVQFDIEGTKTLLLKYARLRVIG